MLEPNSKTIHPTLQPHEEVNLSCHVLTFTADSNITFDIFSDI